MKEPLAKKAAKKPKNRPSQSVFRVNFIYYKR